MIRQPSAELSIWAIVVTYNGERWVDRCIPSLLENRRIGRVIVVDNGSTDGTLSAVSRFGPRVQLVPTPRNLGFGAANNIGMALALQGDADGVFLLNQDAWVASGDLDSLIAIQLADPGLGIVCPIQVTADGSALDRRFAECLPAELISDLVLSGAVKPTYPTQFANAAAWLLPRHTLDKVGYFDELFHMYGEDDDYAIRVRQKGLQIAICPSVRVYHDRADRPMSPAEFVHRKTAASTLALKYPRHSFIESLASVVGDRLWVLSKAVVLCNWGRFMVEWRTNKQIVSRIFALLLLRGDAPQ